MFRKKIFTESLSEYVHRRTQHCYRSLRYSIVYGCLDCASMSAARFSDRLSLRGMLLECQMTRHIKPVHCLPESCPRASQLSGPQFTLCAGHLALLCLVCRPLLTTYLTFPASPVSHTTCTRLKPISESEQISCFAIQQQWNLQLPAPAIATTPRSKSFISVYSRDKTNWNLNLFHTCPIPMLYVRTDHRGVEVS